MYGIDVSSLDMADTVQLDTSKINDNNKNNINNII
jgi:hypothetical protein